MDVARGHIFAVFAEEGAVVDGESHRHCRLVDCDTGQWFGILGNGDGVADFKTLDTDNRADVAVAHAFHTFAAHALECVELFDTLLRDGAVFAAQGYLLTLADLAAVYAADGDTAYIFGVVERGDEHLGLSGIILRAGDGLDDGVEQGQDIVGGLVDIGAHPALFCRAVEGGEVELLFGGVEAEHEVEYHLLHLFGAAVGLVDLIDHHDGLEADFYSFLEHEAGLGHGAFECVDEKQAAVGHVEHALDLAAEVGVSRGVDDVDLVAFVVDGYVL